MSDFPRKLRAIRAKYFILGDYFFNIFPNVVTEGVHTENGIIGSMIGEDLIGFPIFYEPQSNNECIYILRLHLPGSETEEWHKVQIADSFKGFVEACKLLENLSVNRDTREEYDDNKLSSTEIEVFLNTLSKLNPNSNIYFWENIFEGLHPDYELKYANDKGVIIAEKNKQEPHFWSVEHQKPITFKRLPFYLN